MQIGEEFPIFQDRTDIAWGQNWQQRLDETLDEVTLLLVIITPGFFRSKACRQEVERFLARERELGREDLILPVYYVSTPELDDPGRYGTDELVAVLTSRQFADWRDLRFKSFTSSVVRRAVAQLASRMRDTFWQAPSGALTGSAESGRAVGLEIEGLELATAATVMARTDPPTHVVDPNEQGHFSTVSAAIEAAQPGDRILVRPGKYQESLVLDKPLEIIGDVGDGSAADIVIQAHGASALIFKATSAES